MHSSERLTSTYYSFIDPTDEKERKSMYIATLYSVKSQSAQTWITQFHLQITPCLPFLRKRSPDGTFTECGGEHLIAAHCSFISTPRGWKAELALLADIQRKVYPEEVTRQLHVMAQARESSPVIDRRSNHRATPPTNHLFTVLFSCPECTVTAASINHLTGRWTLYVVQSSFGQPSGLL